MQIRQEHFWGGLPPEEKLKILNTSHVRGVLTAVTIILVSSGLAIGFYAQWIFWASFCLAPIAFKVTANDSFRKGKSSIMLRFLAARSAARRYAYKIESMDLAVELLFQGEMSREISLLTPGVEEMTEDERFPTTIPVWIALFKDVVVVMSEGPKGARPQFLHQLNRRLNVDGFSPSGGGEYASDRVVELSSDDLDRFGGRRYRLTSATPGALVVFERKLRKSVEEAKAAAAKALARRRKSK